MRTNRKLLFSLFALSIVTIVFQNCAGSDFFVVAMEQVENSSESPTAKLDTCENILYNEFLKPNGYYAFLTQKCGTCHNGLGQAPGFASASETLAWEKFSDKEIAGNHRVTDRAVSDHQPGVTGPQNTSIIDPLKEAFAASQIKFDTCKDAQGDSGEPKKVLKPIKAASLSLAFFKDAGEDLTDAEKQFLRNEVLKYYVEEKAGTGIYLENLQTLEGLNVYERPIFDTVTNRWKKQALKKVSTFELTDEEAANIRVETYKLYDTAGKPIMDGNVQKQKTYFLNPFQRIQRNQTTQAIIIDPKTFEPLIEELKRRGQYTFTLRNGVYTPDVSGDEPYVTFKIQIFRSQRPIVKTEQRLTIKKRVNETTVQTLTVARPTGYTQTLDPYIVIKRPSFVIDSGMPSSVYPKYGYQIQDLGMYVNGVLQNDRTIFRIIDSVVCEKTPINVMVNSNSEILPLDFSQANQLQFEFKNLAMVERANFAAMEITCSEDEQLNENVILPESVTYTDLMGATDVNVFKKSCISCHSSTNLAGGFDISSYDRAKERTSKIVERMNNANSPMPPAGILSPTSRKLVQKWVSLGSSR
jgi:mono/diheme cytochrome c family protein